MNTSIHRKFASRPKAQPSLRVIKPEGSYFEPPLDNCTNPEDCEIAILGGTPAFLSPQFVGRPNQGDNEQIIDQLRGILARNWLTNHGPLVQEFEKRVQSITGSKHCIAVSNATMGLEILIQCLDLKGEILVPAWSFVATAHAVLRAGCTPIFCDVDPNTHTISPESIKAAITPETVGILAVHLWGRGCETDAIDQIAKQHNLDVIYDAAHAFACSHRGRMIGNFGRAEVFSFHATKAVNSFEGGIIATNDDSLAAKIRLYSNFGFADYDHVVSLGTNAKMPEICGAMGIASLDALPNIIETNQKNWLQYESGLRNIPGVRILAPPANEEQNFNYVVVDIDAIDFGLNRDQLYKALHAENVIVRRYFSPGIHKSEPYVSNKAKHERVQLQNTNLLAQRTLALPTGTSIKPKSIDLVCELFKRFHERSERISSHFNKCS